VTAGLNATDDESDDVLGDMLDEFKPRRSLQHPRCNGRRDQSGGRAAGRSLVLALLTQTAGRG
jgi:hypothetical protein